MTSISATKQPGSSRDYSYQNHPVRRNLFFNWKVLLIGVSFGNASTFGLCSRLHEALIAYSVIYPVQQMNLIIRWIVIEMELA